MTFVMLNPSTADGTYDDPTIRRCINFAKRESCERLDVVNLFSFRATKPIALQTTLEPVGGVRTDVAIHQKIANASVVVCAWGANTIARERANWFREEFEMTPLSCLGKTKEGAPRHPLYVRADETLVAWP